MAASLNSHVSFLS